MGLELLDDRARALFGLAGEPPADQAVALEAAVSDLLPHTRVLDQALFLSTALRRGVAARSLRAAVAADLGRRAGVAASPGRDDREWRVLVRDDDRRGQPVCGHHVGLAVLGELAGCYVDERPDLARRACELQLRLPIDEGTRSRVQHQIELIQDAT